MKIIFIFAVAAALIALIPGNQAIKCGEFRGCVTKDKENATKSETLVECEYGCAAWGCTIEGILYGGSGCKGDHSVCTNHPEAIHISCKDDPTCAIKKLVESRSQNIDRSSLIFGSCKPDPTKPHMISKCANDHYENGHFSKNEACAKFCKSGKGRCGTFLLPGDVVHSKVCGNGNHCYCNL